MWIAILDDLTTHHAPQRTQIAYRFHLTVASAIGAAITTLTERRAVSAIVFSGGVLQNRLLRSLLEEESARHSVPFMFSEQLPANDGSISFGQALIAAARKTATRAVS
jgi:hydrogenase maturation protein HypF